jgi:hypothetical protein
VLEPDFHEAAPLATEDPGTLENLVARIGEMVESAESQERSPPPVTAQPPPVPAARRRSDPVRPADAVTIDSTRTIRALTPLELQDSEASHWFVIQLMLSEEEIEAEHVPNLDIFDEYRLYCVAGLDQDRVMHALRLGFFSSEVAAQAVAGYLGTFFDSPDIKRISIAERERFADRRVRAAKDVGAAGTRSVIEISGPAPLPDRRSTAAADEPDKRSGAAESSLWSRLLSPLKR